MATTLSTLVYYMKFGLFIVLTFVLPDHVEAGYCSAPFSSSRTYCGVFEYCCVSHTRAYCCDSDTYYGHTHHTSPTAAIVGGIFALLLLICGIALLICCCKSSCPLYQRRYHGQVVAPGSNTVVTGGPTVAVTSYSGGGYAYSQRPMQPTRLSYAFAPQQGYVYSAAQPMPPPYPGQYPPPALRYPGPPTGPGPTPAGINNGVRPARYPPASS